MKEDVTNLQRGQKNSNAIDNLEHDMDVPQGHFVAPLGQASCSVLYDLYDIVKSRKETKEEGSYTCYLFEKGLDKILKKCGEENAEMIIAAKNGDNDELENEICDLLYHIMVLMVQNGVELDKVMEILDQRAKKIGNLKQFHESDHNS